MRRLAVVFVAILVLCTKTGTTQEFDYSDFKDLLQIGGDVQITEITKTRSAKSLHNTIEDDLENFFQSNEVSMGIPFGSAVTFNGRGLENDEFNLKVRMNSDSKVEGRKKKRIKRIIAPILVILLLKAITLIPLALGVLGIKTWNALQLAFVSFITSIVLAVWKLCTKFSDHQQPPHILHEAVHDVHVPHVYHDSHHDHHVVHHDHDHFHDPWNHHYHRSDESAQQMAYSEYLSEKKI